MVGGVPAHGMGVELEDPGILFPQKTIPESKECSPRSCSLDSPNRDPKSMGSQSLQEWGRGRAGEPFQAGIVPKIQLNLPRCNSQAPNPTWKFLGMPVGAEPALEVFHKNSSSEPGTSSERGKTSLGKSWKGKFLLGIPPGNCLHGWEGGNPTPFQGLGSFPDPRVIPAHGTFQGLGGSGILLPRLIQFLPPGIRRFGISSGCLFPPHIPKLRARIHHCSLVVGIPWLREVFPPRPFRNSTERSELP